MLILHGDWSTKVWDEMWSSNKCPNQKTPFSTATTWMYFPAKIFGWEILNMFVKSPRFISCAGFVPSSCQPVTFFEWVCGNFLFQKISSFSLTPTSNSLSTGWGIGSDSWIVELVQIWFGFWMFHLLGHLPTHLYPISIYSSRNYQTRQWNSDSKKKTKSIQPPIRADAPLCSCLPPSCPGLINLHVSLHHTRLPSFHDSPRTNERAQNLALSLSNSLERRKGMEGGKEQLQ